MKNPHLYYLLQLFYLCLAFSCQNQTRLPALATVPLPRPAIPKGRLPAKPFDEDEESEARIGFYEAGEREKARVDLSSGGLTSPLGSSDDVIRAITLSTDGAKIYFAGRVADATTGNDFLVGKMDSAGNFDATYNQDGWATTDFGSNADEVAHAIAWQTNGLVVIGGRAHNGSNWDFALARYSTAGYLDTTNFGVNGVKVHTISSGSEFLRGLQFMTDGRIVATGYTYNSSHYDFAAARYNVDGALDTTFGTSGTTVVGITANRDDCATAVVVNTESKVTMVGGTYNASNNWDVALVKLHTNGVLDTTFDSDGRASTTVGGGNDLLWAATLDMREKLVTAGEANNGSNQDFLLMRYHTNGVLDTLFSNDGVLTATLASGDDIGRGVAVDTYTGRIVMAGTATGTTTDFGLIRVSTNGLMENNFSNPGLTVRTIGSAEDTATGMAMAQVDGTMYFGGRSYNGSNYDIGIIKQPQRQFFQQAFVKASNADSNDHFGTSLVISRDTMIVGSKWESSNETTVTNGSTASSINSVGRSGAAYVYVRNGTVWTQQAYLKAMNATSLDSFGTAAALDGDTAVIGAQKEGSVSTTIVNGSTGAATDDNGAFNGAAYVFTRSGSVWTPQAYLKPSASGSDQFALALGIDGDSIAVGGLHEGSNVTTVTNGTASSTNNSAVDAGAAWVFKRTGTQWQQEAFFKAPNAEAGDLFGYSLAISGDSLVVGAYSEGSSASGVTNGTTASTVNGALVSGAAYVYARTGSTWAAQAYLKQAVTHAGDKFGYNVDMSGDSIIVGAPLESSNTTAIINGATAATNTSNNTFGAAYVFVRSGTQWSQQAYLKPSNLEANDNFGAWVAISGDTAVVGADQEASTVGTIINGSTASTNNGGAAAGAAYVFQRSGTVWTQKAYLKAPNPDAGDLFGLFNGVDGDTVIVSGYKEASNLKTITNGTSASTDNSVGASGAVYVYSW